VGASEGIGDRGSGIEDRERPRARLAYLSLGANLGHRAASLRAATALLDAAEGVNVRRRSRVYETEPVGVTDQPKFLNLVVEVELADEVTPHDLLALAKRIEVDLGRQQRERWGPREIDVDILLFGEERIREPGLEIPHPQTWERGFVVIPLADLVPDMKTPRGETVRELAARLRETEGVDEKEA
jgi:2-amino-4-hydroxy-6-hydroxymethyldihydropteridine diphosphokinase